MHALTPTGADPLTDMLAGVRTRGAVFDRSILAGPWAMRFADGSPLALAVPVRGHAWVIPAEGEPVRLGPAEVALLSGGAPYVIADDPSTKPQTTIRSGRRPVSVYGEDVGSRHLTTRSAVGPGSTLLVNGRYTVDSGTVGPLIAALPALAVVPAGQEACPVSAAAFEDVTTRPQPGQQAQLDRMLDLMLIASLRAWFTRTGAEIPACHGAAGDTIVGPALRLLHSDIAHPWTVAGLAKRTDVSRAALAKRFGAQVGQPPMAYLRERRIALAADLLRDSDATIAVIADRVGYSSPFALSAAFKRQLGISPSQYRAAQAPRATHGPTLPGTAMPT